MKKFRSMLAAFLALVMVFGLVACGGSSDSGNSTSSDGNSSSSSSSSSSNAEEETYEMRLSYAFADTTTHGMTCVKIKEEIEKATDGRVKVTLFPNGQICAMDKEPTMIASGVIEACVSNAGVICGTIPEIEIYQLPFMFGTEEIGDMSIIRAMCENEEFNELLDQCAQAKGYKLWGAIPNMPGNYIMANNVRPIEDPDDLAGLKIRNPGGQYIEKFITEMGGSSMTIAGNEVTLALTQGTVDGNMSGLNHIYLNQQATKYVTMPVWAYNSAPLVVSLEWWNSLPADLQDAISNVAIPAVIEYGLQLAHDAELNAYDGIQKDYGTQITVWDFDDPEIAAFVEEMRTYGIDTYTGAYGDVGQKLVDLVLAEREALGLY